MGEQQLSEHVEMKMKAVNDAINQVKSEYNWIKDNVDKVSFTYKVRKDISDFQMSQIDLILFFLDELKKLHDLKRDHLLDALANLERTTGMTFCYIYCFNVLIVRTIDFNCVSNKLKFVRSFSSFFMFAKKERASAKNCSIWLYSLSGT